MSAIATSTKSTLSYITDWAAFSDLPEAAQSDILTKLNSIHKLLNAKHGTKVQLRETLARGRQVSPTTISNELKAYQQRGWKGLVDGRRFSKTKGQMPAVTREAIKAAFEDHQRNDDATEVRRTFLDRLHIWRRTGDHTYKIEGYTHPPENHPDYDHPAGWSLKTFTRLKQDAYQAALTKQGKKAASAHLPSILTTREGSRFLEKVYFDDQDYDNKIAVAGLSEAVRPVGFNCLDHLTGAQLGYHLRVITKTDDEQTNKALTGKEFTWFSLHQLQTVGYRTDQRGTTHIYEHGTANSWSNKQLDTFSGHHSYEDALHAITNGHVTVDRSGKFNDPTFAGMLYAPSSAGNFRYKTWIETAFRLVRTYMQALPGSVGRKHELAPEELYGIEREERHLASIIKDLPPAIGETMRHEILTYIEFAEILRAVYRAINARTDHNLEAWEQCGFTTPMWRLNEDSNHWMPRQELDEIPDPEERAYLSRRVAQNKKLTKPVNLSPEQAMRKELKDPCIKRLGPEVTPLLIPRQWAIAKTIKSNKTIHLQDPFHTKTRHQYIAQIHTKEGRITLETGAEILCYHNPFDIDNLVICNKRGAYLGTLTRTIPRQTHNQEQTLTQLEQRAALESDLTAAPRARAATIMEERQADRQHNREVEQGITPETKASDRKRKSSQRAAKKFGRKITPAQTTHTPQTNNQETEDWSQTTAPENPTNNTQPTEETW